MRRSTSLRSLLSTHTSYNFGAFGVVLISICFLWINLLKTNHITMPPASAHVEVLSSAPSIE
jgi:hypothetical protein